MSEDRRGSARRNEPGREEEAFVPWGASLPFLKTQLMNVFLCIFDDRAMWVLLAFWKTSWFIVKIGLNLSTMKKFWPLKDPLRLNAFFSSKDVGIGKLHNRYLQGNQVGVF